MQKKVFKLVSLGLLLLFFISLNFSFVLAYSQAIPNPGHGGDTVYIRAGGVDKTLQQAIDDKTICSTNTGSYSSTKTFGQTGDSIYVLARDSQKTFQEAINNKDLSFSNSLSAFSPISYGHNSSQVWISINGVEKTLQQAITAGDFYTLCGCTCVGRDCGTLDSCGTAICQPGGECCTPNCVGKCGGDNDGCEGECPNLCNSTQTCVVGVCKNGCKVSNSPLKYVKDGVIVSGALTNYNGVQTIYFPAPCGIEGSCGYYGCFAYATCNNGTWAYQSRLRYSGTSWPSPCSQTNWYGGTCSPSELSCGQLITLNNYLGYSIAECTGGFMANCNKPCSNCQGGFDCGESFCYYPSISDFLS